MLTEAIPDLTVIDQLLNCVSQWYVRISEVETMSVEMYEVMTKLRDPTLPYDA